MSNARRSPLRWQHFISLNSEILAGKPAITGTRIGVGLVLEQLASGWSVDDVLEAYPHLSREQVLACIGYAVALLDEQRYLAPKPADAASSR